MLSTAITDAVPKRGIRAELLVASHTLYQKLMGIRSQGGGILRA